MNNMSKELLNIYLVNVLLCEIYILYYWYWLTGTDTFRFNSLH